MAETKHSTFRLPPDTKSKLIELAELGKTTQAEVVSNLIQAEHRYRRDEIEKMKASHVCTGESVTMKAYQHKKKTGN